MHCTAIIRETSTDFRQMRSDGSHKNLYALVVSLWYVYFGMNLRSRLFLYNRQDQVL